MSRAIHRGATAGGLLGQARLHRPNRFSLGDRFAGVECCWRSVGLYALGLILFVGGGYRMGLPIPDWLYLFLYCTPLLLGLVVVWFLRLLPR